MNIEHDCVAQPSHRVRWLAAYWQLVADLTPALAAVRDARARLQGQHSGYGKRLDRAIDKRRARHGLGDGPMPLLNVGRRSVDRAETKLAAAVARRDALYESIGLHRNSCELCRTALFVTYPSCDACGVQREHVTQDPPLKGWVWERCEECRAEGIEVPVYLPKTE